MPQQKALQRASNSSNGQSRLCGVKIMSFPNGELCVKRTGVGGKGSGWEGCEPHKGGFTIGVHAQGAQDYVCVPHTHEPENGDDVWGEGEREGERRAHLSILRRSKHVGRDKRKNKIKATNTHPPSCWASFSEGKHQAARMLLCLLTFQAAHRPCIISTAQGAAVAQSRLLLPAKLSFSAWCSPVHKVLRLLSWNGKEKGDRLLTSTLTAFTKTPVLPMACPGWDGVILGLCFL